MSKIEQKLSRIDWPRAPGQLFCRGMFRCVATGVLSLLGLTGCDAGSSSVSDTTVSAALRGCTVESQPPVAPGGYYTNGTSVCTAYGDAHLFHGIARPSLEWGSTGENLGPADFQAMAGWHSNVVRIALNQDFWLSGATLYDPGYQPRVAQVVKWAEAAGLDVILDLHWSDDGNLLVPVAGGKAYVAGRSNQQQMADVNSKLFWTEVATQYQQDGHVLFELYNEPNNVSWSVWLNGGMANGYQVVGMQQLYDAVRGTGANNLIIAGGLDYAFDLTGVKATPIKGYNVLYASHPYKPQNPITQWESSFGYLATGDIAPVITTEFGDQAKNCAGDWDTQLIQFNDAHHISWTAWAWYPGDCSFPSLISNWGANPTVQGQSVKAALLAYVYAPAGDPDAGTANSAVGGEGGASSATAGGTGSMNVSGAGGEPGASGAPSAGAEAGAGGGAGRVTQ